jgi:hypothetical protein
MPNHNNDVDISFEEFKGWIYQLFFVIIIGAILYWFYNLWRGIEQVQHGYEHAQNGFNHFVDSVFYQISAAFITFQPGTHLPGLIPEAEAQSWLTSYRNHMLPFTQLIANFGAYYNKEEVWQILVAYEIVELDV